MTRPLLDTHVWVWWMLGDPRLPDRERDQLDRLPAARRPLLCDISLWEVSLLVQFGRLELADDLESGLGIAASPATVEVQPITSAAVVTMTKLPRIFHQDPADRLIVATARALDVPLATHDSLIRRSRLVPLWTA
jgi:PIN domain nuclease of toxin-antitoxin system